MPEIKVKWESPETEMMDRATKVEIGAKKIFGPVRIAAPSDVSRAAQFSGTIHNTIGVAWFDMKSATVANLKKSNGFFKEKKNALESKLSAFNNNGFRMVYPRFPKTESVKFNLGMDKDGVTGIFDLLDSLPSNDGIMVPMPSRITNSIDYKGIINHTIEIHSQQSSSKPLIALIPLDDPISAEKITQEYLKSKYSFSYFALDFGMSYPEASIRRVLRTLHNDLYKKEQIHYFASGLNVPLSASKGGREKAIVNLLYSTVGLDALSAQLYPAGGASQGAHSEAIKKLRYGVPMNYGSYDYNGLSGFLHEHGLCKCPICCNKTPNQIYSSGSYSKVSRMLSAHRGFMETIELDRIRVEVMAGGADKYFGTKTVPVKSGEWLNIRKSILAIKR